MKQKLSGIVEAGVTPIIIVDIGEGGKNPEVIIGCSLLRINFNKLN